MNFYKIYSAKPYLFLVNDWTLPSDNLLRLRCSVLQRISKLIMTINNKLRDEKLQYDISSEVAKIPVL